MLAQRMSRLGTETAFEVLARAKQLECEGRTIIHLEIGEPDFDTPEHIRRAAAEALEEGWTHYGPSPGDPELREAIADDVSSSRGVEVSPEEVVVVPGAKPIIFFGILALVDEGDDVIYPNPGFPIYESVINFVGARAVPLPLREQNQFRVDVEELAGLVTPRTKMIIINSPENPTGSVLTAEDLEALARLAVDNDIWIMSDEAYSRMVYDGEHLSIIALPGIKERTILMDGFSKSYAMTGWRLGYGVAPKPLADAMAKLETNCNSCTTSFVQRAGIAALKGPQEPSEAMMAEFKRRRDIIVEGLNSLPGVSCLMPGGAFYAFPNITETGVDCRTLAKRILEEAGVAVLSGTAFGEYGEGYLRLSYANSVENLKAAIEAMREFLSKL
ncbi:MAG: pyridoxal phosphate-dependent aminotransferase [Armatimonadetes bacterium]|nr:pyridoxal phosphate-dependent aminotransferase [Armatimonadota bacterium]